ncbi:MAG: class I SAM-dependent methyltransferase [Verrucomicrobiota bacterium]
MAGFEDCNWYDYPRYYDVVFGPDTAWEADFLERVWGRFGAARAGRGRKRVLEPACGTGRLVIEMGRRGYEGVGFDCNEAMVRYAGRRVGRFKGLPVTVVEGRMEGFRVSGRFDMAFCLLSTFKYLLSEADALACLRGMERVLKPGGLFVMGLHLTDYGRARPEHERWVGEDRKVRVVCNTRTWPADRKKRLERIRTRLAVECGGTVERRLESEWMARTYDLGQLKRLIGKVRGLEMVGGYDFGEEIPEEGELEEGMGYVVVVLRTP